MTPHSSVDNLVKLEQQSQGGSADNLKAKGKRGSTPDLGDLGAAVAGRCSLTIGFTALTYSD